MDPLGIERLLKEIYLWVGGYTDHIWFLQYLDDGPHELLERRTELMVYMARYGRQSIFDWDERTPQELNEAASALSKILVQEKEAQRGPSEDDT